MLFVSWPLEMMLKRKREVHTMDRRPLWSRRLICTLTSFDSGLLMTCARLACLENEWVRRLLEPCEKVKPDLPTGPDGISDLKDVSRLVDVRPGVVQRRKEP